MPIVKVSDDGKESIIDAAADARRKRNAKIGASVATLGAVISFGLFFSAQPRSRNLCRSLARNFVFSLKFYRRLRCGLKNISSTTRVR